ncbi:hypothetical protein CHH28_09200 [Bacterioplanes sanyensis]|uniref:DUF3570 domain-containing protein n=1 Tax=Bacterioplanes sanyensis TaxID=1249553 RepID=A0A222FJT2_9GAMM|nr:DUF3570 domain-containing protein [Bacterioplanes sanyensis]ASP38846.1 hypothetical protein CHH28_09200 [Bacterioplanes sanyensis]
MAAISLSVRTATAWVLLFSMLLHTVCIAAGEWSYHALYYVESDDRVTVEDHVAAFKHSFGVDYDFSMDVGYDAISGASPTLRSNTAVLTQQDAQARQQQVALADEKSDKLILGFDPNADYRRQNVELEDIRRSVNASLLMRDALRNELTVGASFSKEEDYTSSSASVSQLWWADRRKNRSYSVGASVIYNESYVFTDGYADQYIDDNLMWDAEVSVSQVLSDKAHLSLSAYINHDRGYLSNHYQTIVRGIDLNNDQRIDRSEWLLAAEERPDQRTGGGVGALHVWQWNSGITSQLNYRYFDDDWGIASHTLNWALDIPVSDQLTVLPVMRVYQQQAAFFYKDADGSDIVFDGREYGSSDQRLGEYTAWHAQLGAQWRPWPQWRLDASAAFYQQSSDFDAYWLMLGGSYQY